MTRETQIRPPHTPQRDLAAVVDFLRSQVTDDVIVAARDVDAETTTITGLAVDSRLVLPGDAWIATQGMTHHGAQHWQQALDNGCAVILTDSIGRELLDRTSATVPIVCVPESEGRTWLGRLCAWFYGSPAESLHSVAVTGTNGKTSMTHFLVAAWAALSPDPVACMGTLGVRVYADGHMHDTSTGFTTPEAPVFHACLEALRQRGVHEVAMEVSSHALALGRVDGFTADLAMFTNLSHDHLDFHGNMENYFEAKALLFTEQHSKQCLVCVDEPWGRKLATRLREQSRPLITYGATESDVQLVAFGEGRCTVRHSGGTTAFAFAGPGEFNAVNATGTFAALLMQGVGADDAAQAMSAVSQVPGRMEVVSEPDEPLTVVDYAHSPDSIERVLQALRSRTTGKLIAVLGAGGDRDAAKRPLMGAAAMRAGADVLIITDDNPRSEDPAVIRAAVRGDVDAVLRSGLATLEIIEIGDRASAINHAVRAANVGDTVAVLGKGAETGQQVGETVTPFDDREETRRALQSQRGSGS